jgi:hypothetical protein
MMRRLRATRTRRRFDVAAMLADLRYTVAYAAYATLRRLPRRCPG